MRRLASYVGEAFVFGNGEPSPLVNPATEEQIGEASTQGIDFAAAVSHARQGQTALAALSFSARGALLTSLSRLLHGSRDELLSLAMENGGNTRGDAKFDVDGAIGTLAAYGEIGKQLGDTTVLHDGEGCQPTRSARLWGEHLFLSRCGVALHINAFNFPAWGLCEKAAVAWLCGLPVISKPATSTAMLACRIAEIIAGSGLMPRGAFSLIAGSIGDLMEHLGGQDVVAFTGSSETATMLRRHPAVVSRGVRLNVEADSLNAAILGPDGEEGSEVYDLFLADVIRDITQKTGQKCTAIRRIFVPQDRVAAVAEELRDRLARVRVGNPIEESVTMGPLATRAQLESVRNGIRLLAGAPGMRLLCGGPGAIEGEGSPQGKGYFVAPTLLLASEPARADAVHQHEVFGPVATILPYAGPADLIDSVRRGGGGLVASLYSDDRSLIPALCIGIGPYHGRLFLGSARLAGHSPGPGTVLPHLNHGGPGRAGDGHELGGVRGMQLYMQRCAVMGYRPAIEGLLPGARTTKEPST